MEKREKIKDRIADITFIVMLFLLFMSIGMALNAQPTP